MQYVFLDVPTGVNGSAVFQALLYVLMMMKVNNWSVIVRHCKPMISLSGIVRELMSIDNTLQARMNSNLEVELNIKGPLSFLSFVYLFTSFPLSLPLSPDYVLCLVPMIASAIQSSTGCHQYFQCMVGNYSCRESVT